MKDFKGRECSSRHFRRGNKFVPVLIPLAWRKEWRDLKKRCMQSGEKDIPEEQYWQWRQQLETTATSNLFQRSIKFLQALKHHFFRLG